MADLYANWAALVGDTNPDGSPVNVEGRDWMISMRSGPVGGVRHMAIHGGAIEPPPQQLADYCAGSGAFYTFAGLKPSNNVSLHITSSHYDEPRALAFAADAGRIVSWHGHADRTAGYAVTYVGGLDTQLAALIRARLTAAGFTCEDAPSDLGGVEPLNITNRSMIGRGVQLEMSRSQREQFFAGGNLARSAIEDPANRTEAFYRYADAVNQGIADLYALDERLFDLRGGARAVFPDGIPLNQTRVHQQADYDPVNNLLYVTQVIGNGVKLADESEPPATGIRDSRGDIAINRVNVATGAVTGVMYCRRFDHGSGIGVEYDASTSKTWLWLAYDAEQQPVGTNAHGRRIVRLEFKDGDIVDVGRAGLDVYTPVNGAESITPALDLANGRMGIAYSTGGTTQYAVYDLAQFKAKAFNAPLHAFPRPSYPAFQSWTLYGNYIYQHHGAAYSDANPGPPGGNGNAYFTVIDVRTGNVVDRVLNTYAASMVYREPESIAVWRTSTGPQLVFGFAQGDPQRLMALYAITATVDTSSPIRADVVGAPDPGIQLTVSVADVETIQSWSIDRLVGGVAQTLFSGTAESLPSVSTWIDSAPPGCIPLTYRLTVQRTNGAQETSTSQAVTFVPEGGCNQGGEAVGGGDNVLGCAGTYTARIHWRGGALPYESAAMDRLTAVAWSRTINDVAEASVTVLKGDLSPECCKALGRVEPWVHELSVYRDEELVWQGPVLKTTAGRDSIKIEALDVFAWLDKLVNTFRITYTTTTADSQGRRSGPITRIAQNHLRLNLEESSLSRPPDYPGIMDYLIVRNTGLPTVKVEKDGSSDTAVWGAYLGDIFREWAKRGLTWTTIGRALLLRGKPTSATRAAARLTMEDFAGGDIEVIRDGSQGATYGFATTQDQQNITEGKTLGTGKTGTAYGRLDVLVSVDEEKPKDEDLRQAAREAIAGRYPVPTSISVPDGSSLAATAPVTVRQLVPGERFDVFADDFCSPVLQGFILTDVEGSWQNNTEKIAITLTPLADIDEELTS